MKQYAQIQRVMGRIAFPFATLLIALSGCKNNNATEQTNDETCSNCIEIVVDNSEFAHLIDSLLTRNQTLSDSLNTVNKQLTDCKESKKPAPKPAQPNKPTKPVPVKPMPQKQATTAPTPERTEPTKPCTEQPINNQIINDTNNQGNNAVIIGNNNNVNNVVINGCTSVVLDTLNQVKTTRRTFIVYAKTTYTK